MNGDDQQEAEYACENQVSCHENHFLQRTARRQASTKAIVPMMNCGGMPDSVVSGMRVCGTDAAISGTMSGIFSRIMRMEVMPVVSFHSDQTTRFPRTSAAPPASGEIRTGSPASVRDAAYRGYVLSSPFWCFSVQMTIGGSIFALITW